MENKNLNNISKKRNISKFKFFQNFSSFSDMEGLGIPPIEATLLKNKFADMSAVVEMSIGKINFYNC